MPTRVGIANTKLPPQEFMAQLAPNEGVAFVVESSGRLTNLKKTFDKYPALKKIAAYSKDFADNLLIGGHESWAHDDNIPERSTNSVYDKPNKKNQYNIGKNCIALKYNETAGLLREYGLNGNDPNSIIKALAYSIVHGAGHNAQAYTKSLLNEGSAKNWDHYGGALTDGKEMGRMVKDRQLKFDDFYNPNLYSALNDATFKAPKHAERNKYSQKIISGVDVEQVIRDQIMEGLNVTKDSPRIDRFLEKKIIMIAPHLVPNLTYKISMAKHFGKHKAVANSKLGYIPK